MTYGYVKLTGQLHILYCILVEIMKHNQNMLMDKKKHPFWVPQAHTEEHFCLPFSAWADFWITVIDDVSSSSNSNFL